MEAKQSVGVMQCRKAKRLQQQPRGDNDIEYSNVSSNEEERQQRSEGSRKLHTEFSTIHTYDPQKERCGRHVEL